MFFSCLLFLASVHSFTFVAATPEPLITAAPLLKRDIADGSSTDPILATQSFDYSALPEKVNPFNSSRGTQTGYNICNSSTEGPKSDCQTLIATNISHFCLWGSPDPNSMIGDEEANVVAYCTMKGFGTRLIADGTITGLQFVKTDAYIQWVGWFGRPRDPDAPPALNLKLDDDGGELDPHGADLRGNPMGGLVYSPNANGSLVQVKEWNMFVSAKRFCFKACFTTGANKNLNVTGPEPSYCQNRYDLLGCDYNMPSNVTEGEYTQCESDLQDEVGKYVQNGTTLTYSMPTANPHPPYTPRIPASSNCVTYQSTELFGVPSSTSGSVTATGSTGSGSSTQSGSTPTSTKSSALNSMAFPPAFYSVGLAIMAGVALVL